MEEEGMEEADTQEADIRRRPELHKVRRERVPAAGPLLCTSRQNHRAVGHFPARGLKRFPCTGCDPERATEPLDHRP